MNTFADLGGLAAQTYKNKKKAVELILREAVSNAIHACIIEYRQGNIGYLPQISIYINSKENNIKIIDNGVGFSESDKKNFFDIAKSNELKQKNNLPSKGFGRLALVYFGKDIYFETVHNQKAFSFTYPLDNEVNLLDFVNQPPRDTDKPNGTNLKLNVDKSYMETFIKKFKVIDDFEEWILDEFAFLLYDFNNLKIHIDIDSNAKNIELYKIDTEKFEIEINKQKANLEILTIDSKYKLNIRLIAHKLPILQSINYDRTINELKKKVYIASPLLDDRIAADGLSAEIEDIKQDLEQEITKILDKKFEVFITKQQRVSCNNLRDTQTEFPFLADFMPSFDSIKGYKIQQKKDFIQEAIQEKGKLEQSFWESKDAQLDSRLQKSALYLYVKHRERVLDLLKKMMGDSSFDEDDFHQLLTDKECEYLSLARHNLWVLDDKFSYFVEAHNAKRGEKKVDVEFYINPFIDNESKPTHIVLVELKKLKKAHNAGSMVEQLKGYASDIYKKAQTKSGVDIDVSQCKFFGYIIANYTDIQTEYQNFGNKIFKSISYTTSSYEGIISFFVDGKEIDISVVLLASQDLLNIATLRNKILFDLLKKSTPKISDNESNAN